MRVSLAYSLIPTMVREIEIQTLESHPLMSTQTITEIQGQNSEKNMTLYERRLFEFIF